jgi:hypothetical protein
VISRPTTDQIILDCRRELLETVLPAVSDPAVTICLQMMENVLRNAATRAAHEIAWMLEESERMLAYATEVVSALPESAATAAAVEAAGGGKPATYHLQDVVDSYSRASEAFSCALEAAVAGPDPDLAARGVAILEDRTATELEIKGEWSMIGRG